MKTDDKRRKFIQATLMTPLAVGVAGRLHGMPASINPISGVSNGANRLILPLAHAGIPAEALTDLAQASALIESVLTDETAASDFFSSPGSYFDTHGMDGSDSTLVDPTVKMLVALTDPSVKYALQNKDYASFFDYMRVSGIFEPRDTSVLQNKIQQIISENIDEIKKAVREQRKSSLPHDEESDFMVILKSAGATATEEDFAAISYILGGDANGNLAPIDLVGVGFFVFVLAVVVVVVALVVSAAVTANVAVKINAVVDGNDDAVNPQMISSPFTGEFMKLDPVAIRNIRRGYRIAEITQDGRVRLHLLREAIREEVAAVLASLSNLKLIQIPRQNMPMIVDAVTRYAWKTTGVPSHGY